MEYNLVHAMLGRFGILIPLLGLFFELGAVISGKKLISRMSGGIVIAGYVIVVLAGITGIEEFIFLKRASGDATVFVPHLFLSSTVIVLFTIISSIRIFLYKNVVEKLVIAYFVLYVIMVVLNLLSNEIVVRTMWGR